jgi:hypothetical protein
MRLNNHNSENTQLLNRRLAAIVIVVVLHRAPWPARRSASLATRLDQEEQQWTNGNLRQGGSGGLWVCGELRAQR